MAAGVSGPEMSWPETSGPVAGCCDAPGRAAGAWAGLCCGCASPAVEAATGVLVVVDGVCAGRWGADAGAAGGTGVSVRPVSLARRVTWRWISRAASARCRPVLHPLPAPVTKLRRFTAGCCEAA